MTFDLTREATVLVLADSLTAVDNPPHQYRMQQPLVEESDYVYLKRNPSRGKARAPNWITKSFTGLRWDNVEAVLPGYLASYNPTHLFIECGTNEVSSLRATTQAALAACAAMLGSVDTLVIGPYAYGEEWPSGENDGTGASNDARLDETAVDIANIFVPGVPKCVYLNFRATLYEVTMPPLNSPTPGNYIGPFTIDGVHLSARGRAVMWSLIRQVVRFL